MQLYTEEGKFIDSVELEKNNIIIQFQGVHEYFTLEDSKVLKLKMVHILDLKRTEQG